MPHPGDPGLSTSGAIRLPPGLAARGATLFAVAWVLIQVGLPLFLLGTGVRPLPFGWHMYSGAYPFPLVVVEVAGGAPVRVDMQPYIPHTRLDLDYTRYIPPFICAEVPGAIAVRLQLPGNPSPERHRCP